MRRVFGRWERLTASVALAVVLTIGAGGLLLTGSLADQLALAQGGSQPAGTEELFAPFWEAWDLLHANYVDPLDDDVLAAGALQGMLRALDDPTLVLPLPAPVAGEASSTDEPFAPFWEAWERIHARLGASVDDDALMQGALRGMLQVLGDPHTDYMDPETFARVNEGMSGEYEGIGATVRQDEETGGLELVTIMQGSPAERAGLRSGDQIVRVEDEDVTSLTQNEIIARVRGPAGTLVRLGILRPGVAGILDFEVVREKISVPSVVSRVLDGNIGYIRLSQFEFSTSQEMRVALQAMNANQLDGLILDVRGNPGGYLTTSIEVASAYIREGTVVIERGPDRTIEHHALGNAIAPDVPMVVLVDQGSASASELISGALQDHGRAVIVGMPTFGKGSVQTWHELSNGGGVRITISRWYTPDGRSVSDVGIQPDVLVEYVPEQTAADGIDNQLAVALKVVMNAYRPAQAARDATPAALAAD